MVFINIIGIGILIIFLLFILPKKNKVTSDYLLITTIIVLGLFLFSEVWIQQGLTLSKHIFQYLSNTFLFPIFITYGLVLIDEEHKIRKKWWWIYSFAVLFSIFIFFDVSVLNDYNTMEELIALHQSPSFIHKLIYKVHYIFNIAVLIWFLKKIKRYQQRIKEEYSFIELIHLKWIENFTFVLLILYIIEVLLFFILDIGIHIDMSIVFTICNSLMLLSVFYLCYNGIKQYSYAEFNNLLLPQKLKNVQSNEENNDLSQASEKYKTSSLSEEEMNLLFTQINEIFEKDQVYLDPQLKIQNIADRLQSSTHKVSQTINAKGGTSFYYFVNGYRVEHFKTLLSDPENRKYTILALGIESGFNSKATLNRIFKQFMRVSPKEFQKSHFTN